MLLAYFLRRSVLCQPNGERHHANTFLCRDFICSLTLLDSRYSRGITGAYDGAYAQRRGTVRTETAQHRKAYDVVTDTPREQPSEPTPHDGNPGPRHTPRHLNDGEHSGLREYLPRLSEPPTSTGPINLPTLSGAVPVLEDGDFVEREMAEDRQEATAREEARRTGALDGVETRYKVTALIVFVLTTISATGPLATDMYIPAFPQVLVDFDTTAARLQLTLTAFFLGTASGQILAGPLSDRLGRRAPLIVGLVLCLLGSVGCALATNVDMMTAMRVLQGFGGGFGMVLGRAVLIDLASGPELFRTLNIMQGIGGIAPIVAPLLGGVVLLVSQWQAVFWVIGSMTAISLIGVIFAIPESLPADKRQSGGLRTFLRNVKTLLKRPIFTIYLLVNAFSAFALMSYVSASTFVVQDMLGFSSTVYSVSFAVNSTGMMAMSFLSARLVRTIAPRVLIGIGLSIVGVAATALLIGSLLGTPPAWLVFPAFFFIVAPQGLIFGNGAAMASSEATDLAGTGSALLGLGFSFAASSAAPLVGLAGSSSSLPMAVTMTIGVVISLIMWMMAGRITKSRTHAA